MTMPRGAQLLLDLITAAPNSLVRASDGTLWRKDTSTHAWLCGEKSASSLALARIGCDILTDLEVLALDVR